MVNPGHTSKGCTTCKSRRVRCDYNRPICLRCEKSKRVCLGYNIRKRQIAATGKALYSYDDVGLGLKCSATGWQVALDSPPGIKNYEAQQSLASVDVSSLLQHLTATYAAKFPPQLAWCNIRHSPAAGEESLARVVMSVLGTICQGFCSLRQSVQTTVERKALLAAYGSATGMLREALAVSPASLALTVPISLFALYEMVVNLNPADRTWQMHLNAVLSLLWGRCGEATSITLCKAMSILDSGTEVHETFASSALNGSEKALLLLDVVKLQLRKLSLEGDALFNNPRPNLRQLDVQKLRVSIRQIHKNLKLCHILMRNYVHAPMDYLANDLFVMRWNELHTLQIVTAALLLRCGSFLHADQEYPCTREFAVLSSIIQEAVDGICSSVSYCRGPPFNTVLASSGPPPISIARALALIWPLYCASTAPGVSKCQQSWLREALWLIGTQNFIPKALSLADPTEGDGTQTDILAGMLLISLMVCLVPQGP